VTTPWNSAGLSEGTWGLALLLPLLNKNRTSSILSLVQGTERSSATSVGIRRMPWAVSSPMQVGDRTGGREGRGKMTQVLGVCLNPVAQRPSPRPDEGHERSLGLTFQHPLPQKLLRVYKNSQ